MKTMLIKNKIGVLGIILCLMFTQCQSVEISFLGYFNKKYGAEDQKAANAPIATETVNKVITIAGAVTDKTFLPLEVAKIFILKNGRKISYNTSDSDGKFVITKNSNVEINVDDTTNTFALLIEADGYMAEQQKIDITTQGPIVVNFALQRLNRISGIVSSSNGAPLADVNVTLSNLGKYYKGSTGPNGEYLMDNIEDGTYNIEFSGANFTKPGETITLGNGTDFKNINYKAGDGELSGTIKTSDAKATVANIRLVQINNTDNSNITYSYFTGTTDASDFYKVTGLTVGKYILIANASNYESITKQIELKENQMLMNFDFTLKPIK